MKPDECVLVGGNWVKVSATGPGWVSFEGVGPGTPDLLCGTTVSEIYRYKRGRFVRVVLPVPVAVV